MEIFPSMQERNSRVVDLVRQREIQDSVSRTIFTKLHVTDSLISRLGLEKELVGHTGCVNCLEWNESGEILASASDDLNIILWDPFRYEKKLVIQTGHIGNVFSVKFLPKTNDTVLVTGSADHRVIVRYLTLAEPIINCYCHTGRVKRIATAPTVPHMFWTAAEDGVILQYDIRTPHTCASNGTKNVLINLVNHMGLYAEAKCISINPKKPELIAVGANDEYIRMYDRRMIKLSQLPNALYSGLRDPSDSAEVYGAAFQQGGQGDPDSNIPVHSAQYFVAGHLPFQQRDSNRSLTTTYLTFSGDGNELLVNMGGEQIYLFDINNPRWPRSFFVFNAPQRNSDSIQTEELEKCCAEKSETLAMDDLTGYNVKTLPPHVEELKRQANECFGNRKFVTAINLYNKAISFCPTAAVLCANRAAAYMKRAWDGDTYAALRDCHATLLLDPDNVKAHFRLARCLLDLNRAVEARKVIKAFQRRFPVYAANPAYKALKMDIEKALEVGKRSSQADQEARRISENERVWRRNSIDYKMRFCGHCNTTTDIKEANFFGNTGQYIVAGSDDGSFFIWDRNTTNILRVLHGDDRIVNCLQPHQSTCLLATSGIDPVIRLWSPLPEDGSINKREIPNLDDAAAANQIRMNSDPFEIMLMNMGYRFPVSQASLNNDSDAQQERLNVQSVNCRPS